MGAMGSLPAEREGAGEGGIVVVSEAGANAVQESIQERLSALPHVRATDMSKGGALRQDWRELQTYTRWPAPSLGLANVTEYFQSWRAASGSEGREELPPSAQAAMRRARAQVESFVASMARLSGEESSGGARLLTTVDETNACLAQLLVRA